MILSKYPVEQEVKMAPEPKSRKYKMSNPQLPIARREYALLPDRVLFHKPDGRLHGRGDAQASHVKPLAKRTLKTTAKGQ